LIGRALPEPKIDAINALVELSLEINFNQNVNENLNDLQDDIRQLLNDISPLKPTKIKKEISAHGLIKSGMKLKSKKNIVFRLKNNSDNNIDLQKYKWARFYFQSLNRLKMIEHFKSKELRKFQKF
jgi:hypothetical protein